MANFLEKTEISGKKIKLKEKPQSIEFIRKADGCVEFLLQCLYKLALFVCLFVT